ncbi:MAG: ATP-binding protein [Methanosarcinaceae archaeon]|nr:ATP-binding protein [Methanosarcinaceae archaeon]
MFRNFINRVHELEYLEKEYISEGPSFTVIYGRRRVGKTELIQQFVKDRPHIFFLADMRGTRSNALRFRKRAAEFFGDMEPAAETFDEVSEYISKRWTGEQKLVIVIDEFSYLAQADEAIPSVFQLIVDEILKGGPFHLILCGSSVSMMERTTLAHSGPLYGRRTGQIQVMPLALRHLRGFFPDSTPEGLLRIYGAAGGIPFYLGFFDPDKALYENLEHNMFSREAVLYAEGEFLLREELREPATYMNILYSISGGATRAGEIAAGAFIETKDLSYYMDTLIKLGFIRKEHPVAEKSSSRKTIYVIDDPFLRFWFRYVLVHRDSIEAGDSSHAIGDLDKSYDRYLGETFEQVSREILTYLNLQDKLPFRFRSIGRQWGKIPGAPKGKNDYEIDLVALDQDSKNMLFCECKWQKQKVNADVYFALKERSSHVKWFPERKEHFALISRSGFTKKMHEIADQENVLLLTLDNYLSGTFTE